MQRFMKRSPAAQEQDRTCAAGEFGSWRYRCTVTRVQQRDRLWWSDTSANSNELCRMRGLPASPSGLLHVAAPDVYGSGNARRPKSPTPSPTRQLLKPPHPTNAPPKAHALRPPMRRFLAVLCPSRPDATAVHAAFLNGLRIDVRQGHAATLRCFSLANAASRRSWSRAAA